VLATAPFFLTAQTPAELLKKQKRLKEYFYPIDKVYIGWY
jgi:hypothetical protein